MVQKLTKYETVEVVLTSTAGTFNFPDLPQLRNAQVLAMEVYTADMIAASVQTGGTAISQADAKKCVVTLYEGAMQTVDKMPLVNFNRNQSSSTSSFNRDQLIFDGQVFSWTKCQVSVVNGQTVSANSVVSFGIYYIPGADLGY